MASIRRYLEVMCNQIAEYHASVDQLLPEMINHRAEKLGALRKLEDDLI